MDSHSSADEKLVRSPRQVATAIAELAHGVPADTIKGYAEAILAADPEGCERASRSFIASRIPIAATRDRLRRFHEALLKNPTPLRGHTIAIALLAAAQSAAVREENSRLELVWTGPEVEGSPFRHTEQAVQEVVDSAEESIILVSFAVFRIPNLRDRIEQACHRGVDVSIIIEDLPDRIRGGLPRQWKALGDGLLQSCRLYYWPDAQRPADSNGRKGTLHVKCAVSDQRKLFLSSANLTAAAFSVNMELGVLISGGDWPHAVDRHFRTLVASGTLVRIRPESGERE